MMRDQPELRRRAANYVTLSPVSFLQRAAAFFGDRTAVLHGARRYTYAEFYARARRLAHALTKAGIRSGDVIADRLLFGARWKSALVKQPCARQSYDRDSWHALAAPNDCALEVCR